MRERGSPRRGLRLARNFFLLFDRFECFVLNGSFGSFGWICQQNFILAELWSKGLDPCRLGLKYQGVQMYGFTSSLPDSDFFLTLDLLSLY